jgi:hypothetical protein
MRTFLKDSYFRLLKRLEGLILRMKVNYTRWGIVRDTRVVIKQTGKSAVTHRIKREMRQYSRERFGSAAYWRGLAMGVEMKGEFVRGWIPFDYFYYFLEPSLNPPRYRSIGDFRTLDYRRFGDFTIRPLLQFISGMYFNTACEPVGEQEISRIMSDHNDLIVIKQEFGWGGKEVRVMHSSEFKPGLLLPGLNYIIQPFLKQYKVLHDLHPSSVNTFRVLTFRKKDGSVKVLLTYLRFGVDGSKVDNLSSGGQCVRFDASGKPEVQAYNEFGLKCGDRHKNSGKIFAELEIPMFQEVVDKCVSTHLVYPHVRLIGWDICIDETGAPKLIEWNSSRPSFSWEDFLFGPFFPDDKEF